MSIWVSILLLLICVGMSGPLTLLGGFLGRRVKRTQFPMPTNRQIPSKDQFPRLWIFVAGVVPFGCIMYVATFSIMSSIWWGRAYYPSPGNLSLLLQLLVLVCSHESQLLTFPNSPFRGSPASGGRSFLPQAHRDSTCFYTPSAFSWMICLTCWMTLFRFSSTWATLFYWRSQSCLLNRVAAIIPSCASCLYGESEIFGNLNRDQQLTRHLVQ